jgi:predicted 3-demethylubiquinone-9 3-methyltransferase (glyoxalase superfamily)
MRETSMSVLEELPRITPFLWLDNNAEDAVNFSLPVFKSSGRDAGHAEDEKKSLNLKRAAKA